MRPARAAVGLGVIGLSFATACGGGESPTGANASPSLTVISGANVSDSVGVPFTQPLTVQLTAAGNQPAPGVAVHFSAGLPTDPTRAKERVVQISAVGDTTYADTVSATTDAQGRASVSVRAGTVAQQTTVAIAANGLSAAASFTVTPGATIKISADPLVLPFCLVGGTAKYNLVAVDRFGNRNTNLTYSIDSTVATMDADGTVHGKAPGVAVLTTTSGALQNFQFVGIVPSTPVMMSQSTATQATLITMRLDGTQRTPLLDSVLSNFTAPVAFDAAMGPDGTLYYVTTDSSRIHVRSSGGADRRLTPASLGTVGEFSPRPSPDGQWIYFVGGSATSFRTLWRIHPDGTAGEQIGPTTVYGSNIPSYEYPTVDPNGAALYVDLVNFDFGTDVVERFDLATRSFNATVTNSIDGVVYSPQRDRFVYSPQVGGLVIRTVATGAEVSYVPVGTPGVFSSAPWTSDGRLVVFAMDGEIGVMDGATGRTAFMPNTTASIFSAPAWVP